MVNSTTQGFSRLYLNFVDPRSSVGWILHDSQNRVNWGMAGALRIEVGDHGYQSTVSL